jgi:hypothetical protein
LYKGVQFNMAQFRGIVHRLATEGRRLLTEDLMFGNSKAAKPILSVPWKSMRDNLTDEWPRRNFCEGPLDLYACRRGEVVVRASREGSQHLRQVHKAGKAPRGRLRGY